MSMERHKRTEIQRVTGWIGKAVGIENSPLLSDWIAEAFFYKKTNERGLNMSGVIIILKSNVVMGGA